VCGGAANRAVKGCNPQPLEAPKQSVWEVVAGGPAGGVGPIIGTLDGQQERAVTARKRVCVAVGGRPNRLRIA